MDFYGQNNQLTYFSKRIGVCQTQKQSTASWGYEILKTIEARSTYAEEDWLILIVTDHGGTEYGHGGQTPFERMTWLACNQKIEVNEENLQFALTK